MQIMHYTSIRYTYITHDDETHRIKNIFAVSKRCYAHLH